MKKTCLIALLAAGACATPGRMMTASTLGAGAVEGGFETSVIGAAGSGGAGAIPMISGVVRVGVTDNVDVGARLGFAGLELQSRIKVAGENGAGTVVSIAPAITGSRWGIGGENITSFGLTVPALIGLQQANGSELIISPHLQTNYFGISSNATNSSSSAILLSAGAGIGYSAKVSGNVRLVPELTLSVPFAAIAGASADGESISGAGAGVGGFLFQGGLGVTFGRRTWDDPK